MSPYKMDTMKQKQITLFKTEGITDRNLNIPIYSAVFNTTRRKMNKRKEEN